MFMYIIIYCHFLKYFIISLFLGIFMALGRGNLLKKALPSESPSLYQAMRCISSKIHVSGFWFYL